MAGGYANFFFISHYLGVGKQESAHQFVGALVNAEDVEKTVRFAFGDRLGTDHAAIGDDAHALHIQSISSAFKWNHLKADEMARIQKDRASFKRKIAHTLCTML